MPNLIYSLFKQFEKDNLSLLYQGDFTNYVLGMATDLIKTHLEDEKGFRSLRNKLSFLMIESFQNIVRYADSHRANELQLADELFITRNVGDVFYISTSNIVENEKAGFVKGKLDSVNSLEKKELKDLYVKVLKNKKLSEQGGAGLGFIEMVRKSKEKLDFDFERINDEISIFYFQIRIKSKLIESIEKDSLIDISETKKLHKIISKEKIILAHKGDFSEDTIYSVFSMVEDNTKMESITQRKRVFHTMVETLQNISKHAYINEKGNREGIFILAEIDKKFAISGGNYIETSKADKFKTYMDDLNKMDRDQLNTFYRTVLRGDGIPYYVTGGLGLIDVFRESVEPVKYEFIKENEKLTFFSIKTVI